MTDISHRNLFHCNLHKMNDTLTDCEEPLVIQSCTSINISLTGWASLLDSDVPNPILVDDSSWKQQPNNVYYIECKEGLSIYLFLCFFFYYAFQFLSIGYLRESRFSGYYQHYWKIRRYFVHLRAKVLKMAHRSGKSRRDNFTQSAIAILYKRSGGKCCRCGATTFGPVTNNLTKYRNIGQAAHIAAAAPGGPRYDPNMSAEERTSATNGLWLCSNCHDVIDRDVEEFTIQRLREIKRVGEERARKEVGVATVNVSCNTMPISTFRFLTCFYIHPAFSAG